MDNRPIGIFDSGVGGLTVFKAVRDAFPDESIIYLGDTARVPYGTKSSETVLKYAMQNASFLTSRDVKLIIVACNTASSWALDHLKQNLKIPVLGVVEPGSREGVAKSRNLKIGVIATQSTIESSAYQKEISRLEPRSQIFARSCGLLVPIVEEGWSGTEVSSMAIDKYLGEMKTFGVDTLILGCTHYPILKDEIAKVMGNSVTLVDSGLAVTKKVMELFDKGDVLRSRKNRSYHIYVTDLPARFQKVLERFLGDPIPIVERVDL